MVSNTAMPINPDEHRQVINYCFFINIIRVNEGRSIYLVGIDFLTVFGLRQIASAMQGFFIEKYLILSIGILYIKSVFM
jgi:hypothetical protein